jgi:hypothetical protein
MILGFIGFCLLISFISLYIARLFDHPICSSESFISRGNLAILLIISVVLIYSDGYFLNMICNMLAICFAGGVW